MEQWWNTMPENRNSFVTRSICVRRNSNEITPINLTGIDVAACILFALYWLASGGTRMIVRNNGAFARIQLLVSVVLFRQNVRQHSRLYFHLWSCWLGAREIFRETHRWPRPAAAIRCLNHCEGSRARLYRFNYLLSAHQKCLCACVYSSERNVQWLRWLRWPSVHRCSWTGAARRICSVNNTESD